MGPNLILVRLGTGMAQNPAISLACCTGSLSAFIGSALPARVNAVTKQGALREPLPPSLGTSKVIDIFANVPI
jgi:hypothetical protein